MKSTLPLSVSKKIVLLLVLTLLSGSIFAQTTINGKVLNSKTKQPVEFASVMVKGKATEHLNGATVDAEGKFTIFNLPKDTFQLTATFLGYTDYNQIIITDDTVKIISLEILMSNDVKTLQAVEVTAMRSQMRLELDKKVFDVGQSATAAGASASDILQDIPSVEVSTDGEISLRGSTAVTIWINGKASGLTADNQAQILEQLPADAIDRIEIITNPSAKYSPEGTAGIINIVLKEERKAGYYGSVQAGINSKLGYNFSGNINYSNKKMDAFASIGFRSREMNRGGYSYRKYLDNNGDTVGFLDQNTDANGRNNNIFTRLGLTYHVTPKDHLSISGFGMFGKGKNETVVDYTSNLPNTFVQSNRSTLAKNDMSGGNVQLGYKRDFSKTSNLDLSASYNQWNRDGNSDFKQFSTYLNADSTTRTTNSFQRQISDVVNRTAEFKADYTNTFGKNHKIEAGYQGTFGWENSPMETYSGLSQSTLLATPSLWNTFLYNRMINAVYATYSGKIKNFNYLAGLRGEYSDIDTRSLGYGQTSNDAEPYNTKYFDLFPSVFLSYQLPKDNQVQINYTRRISRPWGGQLNSFKNITDSTNISYGNPLLTPEYSNAFELNYIKTWNSHIFSFSGYYRTSDDVIQRISFMNNGLMNTTSDNIAKTTSTGTELVAKNRFFKILNLTTTLNFYYYYLKGFEYMPNNATEAVVGNSQSNFTWNFRIIAQATLPKGFMAQISGGYNAPQSIAQGTSQARYFIDAGVKKSIKDFTFNLNARDILNSRSNSNTTFGKGFTQEAKNWRGGRTISLSVTYSFGNLKPDMKRRSENNNQDNGESENQTVSGYESE